jgi:prevent-host-death family protein
MQKPINIHEAKTHLSRLVERVEGGEEITLARAGRPVARLVPYHQRREPRRPGLWKGQVSIARDFDAPIPEFERALDQ